MDIQITGIELDGPWIRVQRTVDGEGHGERMPKETLAIRAAEYNLEPDDPRALDIVLLEMFYTPDDPDEIHPLYRMRNIDDALNEVLRRIQIVRDQNNISGLELAHSLLLEHAPDDI